MDLLFFVSGSDGWNVHQYPINQRHCVKYNSLAHTSSNIDFSLDKEQIMQHQGIPHSQHIISSSHKRHICTFCRKAYPLKSLLNRHIQYSCKMNPKCSHFTCTFCPYKSMYKANMERHIKNVHDTNALKYKCELCNFRSSYTFCVRRHMKTFHRITMPNIPNE